MNMKQGISIKELAAKLLRQAEDKRDFLSTRGLCASATCREVGEI